MSCVECTKEARKRQAEFDAKKEEAKKQANEIQKPVAICKKERQGKLFICGTEEAFRERYFVVDIISFVQQVTT